MTQEGLREAIDFIKAWEGKILAISLGGAKKKNMQKILSVATAALEVMEMEDKPCAQNKKWRNTYPQDCQNIGYNQALREIKKKLGGV